MKPAAAKACARERRCLKFMSPPAPWVRMMAVRASLTEGCRHRAASRNFAPNGTFTLTWKPVSSWLIWIALLQQWRKRKLHLGASHLPSFSFHKFNRTILQHSLWTPTLANIVIWLCMQKCANIYLIELIHYLFFTELPLNVCDTTATCRPGVVTTVRRFRTYNYRQISKGF